MYNKTVNNYFFNIFDDLFSVTFVRLYATIVLVMLYERSYFLTIFVFIILLILR